MIGNSATIVAQITIAGSGLLTQMMISGAIATIGVTCRMIAYGNRLASSSRLCTNRNAAEHAEHDRQREREEGDLQRDHQRRSQQRSSPATSVSKMSVGIGTR